MDDICRFLLFAEKEDRHFMTYYCWSSKCSAEVDFIIYRLFLLSRYKKI